MTFDQIKGAISSYRKSDLIEFSLNTLDNCKGQINPVWSIFTLMKWAYLFGESKYPLNELNEKSFAHLCNSIFEINQDYLSQFVKDGNVDRAFLVLYNQQLYLNQHVYRETITTQLKLFSSISGKYDVSKSFKDKTGLSVKVFLQISLIIWSYSNEIDSSVPKFYGYLEPDFWKSMTSILPEHEIVSYKNLLTLNPARVEEIVSRFRKSIKNEELQNLEMTFLTMYPFQYYKNRLKLVHISIFGNVVKNFIYDYLKENDNSFTTEFGTRVEKYVKLSIEELSLPYIQESELKKQIGRDSNLIDFYLPTENVFIECKASELQAYPTVNPTDELIFNSLRTSFIKAYFEQLNPVASRLSSDNENWGIILTYKEFFYSQYTPLYNIAIDKFPNFEKKHLPPENVFIIDLFTWNKIVFLLKENRASLRGILKIAKENNSNPATTKQFFDMHLADFKITQLDLNFLRNEEAEILNY